MTITTSVDRYLRLVVGFDELQGRTKTITPAEPIAADAAASILNTSPNLNWASCIDTLWRFLLQGGLVEKGTKGELYARLIFVLARDDACGSQMGDL